MENYREFLSKIEEVRKQTGEHCTINLPQITVIGDQSSGKSSLLTEVSGVPFPTSSGITTKCPIIVHTENNPDINKPKYTIDNEEVSRDTMCKKISLLQQKVIGSEKVSKTPIKIKAEGPELEDLVLVDLPGIISNGDGKEEIISMIQKYIKPEQSLILIVTEAKQDEENAQALELAQQFDPGEERSIRVLTKYDVFDSEESKDRAKILVSTVDDLSPHAVICRPNGRKDYSEESEQSRLSQYDLPSERAGIPSLKKRLPKILCNLIKTNIPSLKKQVRQTLKENQKSLLEIGEVAPDNTRIILRVQEIFREELDQLPEQLSPAMFTFREKLHQSQEIITDKMVEKRYSPDAFKCIFFQGERTFTLILEEMVNLWQKHIGRLYSDVETILRHLFDTSKITRIPSHLIRCIDNNWEDWRQKILEQLKASMETELQKEKKFKTMNHYLTSKYQENLVLPKELLQKIVDSIQPDMITEKRSEVNRCSYSPLGALPIVQVRRNIQDLIETAVETHSEEFNREPLEKQHQRRILAASKANCAVSYKNLTDNILSTIQKIVLEGTTIWIEKTLIEDEEIKENVGEDSKIRKEREQYKKNIAVMQRCLSILK